jgi:hypothetical protein
MPDILTKLDFLANLPLYTYEKPFLCLLPPDQGIDPDEVRLDNLEFEDREGILVKDMRNLPGLTLNTCGFQYIHHRSNFLRFTTPDDVKAYKVDTENMLRELCGAVHVLCYDLRLRRNQEFRRKKFDVHDPLLVEGPAKGAHNGSSLSTTNNPADL